MRYRLHTLLGAIVLGPITVYWLGLFFGWFPFRPATYIDIALTSAGAALVAAGAHAAATGQMPVRGGGTIAGERAVQSGRVAVAIGALLIASGAALFFLLPKR